MRAKGHERDDALCDIVEEAPERGAAILLDGPCPSHRVRSQLDGLTHRLAALGVVAGDGGWQKKVGLLLGDGARVISR